jgi:hypothetical protein
MRGRPSLLFSEATFFEDRLKARRARLTNRGSFEADFLLLFFAIGLIIDVTNPVEKLPHPTENERAI